MCLSLCEIIIPLSKAPLVTKADNAAPLAAPTIAAFFAAKIPVPHVGLTRQEKQIP